MIKDSLSIHWQMSDPPLTPKSWQKLDFGAKDREGILAGAFMQGLSRQVGWEIPSGAQEKNYLEAAKIFRRGVAASATSDKFSSSNLKGKYDIYFHDGNFTQELLEKSNDKKLFIIDKNVLDLWPDLKKIQNKIVIAMDEHSKTLPTVASIQAQAKASAKVSSWVAVGGGVLCDTVGFAAALEEVMLEFIPTTLLAMADGCVGGKTGVNFPPFGKNQVGRFYFPKQVHIWSGWLQTLPKREYLAGLSECLKHGFLIGDKTLSEKLVGASKSHTQLDYATLKKVVAVKADVVEKDPGETGIRATLNFGHTMGHALEGFSQKNNPQNYLLHGEAVAWGMAFATFLSTKYVGLSKNDAAFILGKLKQSGCLNSDLPNLKDANVIREILGFLDQDKKNISKKVNWILLRKLGEPCFHELSAEEIKAEIASWQPLAT